MQHYFASLIDNKIVLSKDDTHHLLHVRRANTGEEIELVIDGVAQRAIISSLHPLEFSLLEVAGPREPEINLILAFGVLKGSDNDGIIDHCTQIGVNRFIPMLTSRTVVVPKEDDSRIKRLRKIAYESSCQCRRSIIPEIINYTDYNDVLKINADHKIICYENAKAEDNILSIASFFKKSESVLVLIGPEGGFNKEEVEEALKEGFKIAYLGGRILRGETAAIVASSLIIGQTEK